MKKPPHLSGSEEETKELGRELGLTLKEGDIVFLEGDLGSGKTTFVKGILSALGVDESVVTSPTFAYMHLYTETIVHFDLYRLKEEREFFLLGLGEYVEPPMIALIEWPGVISTHVTPSVEVFLYHVEKESRKIEVVR